MVARVLPRLDQRAFAAAIAAAALLAVSVQPLPDITSALSDLLHRSGSSAASAAHRTGDAPSQAAAKAAAPSFRTAPDGSVRLRRSGMAVSIADATLSIRAGGTSASTVTMKAESLARTGAAAPLISAAKPMVTDEAITMNRGAAAEWVKATPTGLQQGWTITKRPAGAGKLHLNLGITGATLTQSSKTALTFVPDNGKALSYDRLRAFDATGKQLTARFAMTGSGAQIVVNDAHATYPIVIDPDLTPIAHIDAADNANQNQFGRAIAVKNHWMAVGEPGYVHAADSAKGRIVVFHDTTGHGDWSKVADLQTTVLSTLGYQVGLLVEGAGVTVFGAYPGGTWGVSQWTFAGDPDTVAPSASPVARPGISCSGGACGSSMSVAGDLMVLGSPNATNPGVYDAPGHNVSELIGQAVVFRRSGGFGGSYLSEATLNPPGGVGSPIASRDVLQRFGTSVAVDASYGLIAVGAPGDDGVQTPTGGTISSPAPMGTTTNNGAVDIFQWSAPSTWTLIRRIASSGNAANAEFGSAVAFAGNGGLVVGAPGDREVINATTYTPGAGYVFDRNTGDPTQWDQYARILPDDPTTTPNESISNSQKFAAAVAADTDAGTLHYYFGEIAQGAVNELKGSVTAYDRVGGTLTFKKRLWAVTPSDPHGGLTPAFGYAIGASADVVVGGAPFWGNATETLAGRAVSYWWDGSSPYVLTADLASQSHPDHGNQFGAVIAQDKDVLAIGLPNSYRSSGYGIGAVATYTRTGANGSWQFEKMFFPYAANQVSSAPDWGSSLAVHEFTNGTGGDVGAVIAIGAPKDSTIDVDATGPTAAVDVTGAGTVATYFRNGAPGTAYGVGRELWANGQVGSPGPAGDPQVDGRFGAAVAFTGDGTLLVGEPGANSGVGRLQRFEKSGTVWAWASNSTPTGEAVNFGYSLTANGTDVAVLSGDATTPDPNMMVRRYTDGDASTAETLVSTHPVGMYASTTGSGLSTRTSRIAVSGSRFAVSSPLMSRVRIYRVVNNAAVLEAELYEPLYDSGNRFGGALDFNHGGSTLSLIVGQPTAPAEDSDPGHAWVYTARIKPGGAAAWALSGQLQPGESLAAGTQFGSAVTNWPANGGVVVGAPQEGSAIATGRVYTYDDSAIQSPAGPPTTVDLAVDPTTPVGASELFTGDLTQSLLTNAAKTEGSIAAAAIGDIDLSQPPKGTSVSASPMGAIPMGAIPMGAIPMGAIPLSSLELNGVPGGWKALLEGSAFEGTPLQSVTWSDVATLPSVQELTLGSIALAGTPMGAIPLASIALGDVALSDLPLDPSSSKSALSQWCEALTAAHANTAALGLDCDAPSSPSNDGVSVLSIGLRGAPMGAIPMGAIPMGAIPMGAIPMGAIPMGAIDLQGSPMGAIPMGAIPMGAIPMGAIPMGAIPMGAIPMGAIPMGAIDLQGSPMGAIPMGAIDLQGSPMGAIPMGAIPMGAIPMGAIPMGAIPMGAIPMGAIPMGAITLGGTPMGAIPMGAIDLSGTGLRDVVFPAGATLADLSATQLRELTLLNLVGINGITIDDLEDALAGLTMANLLNFDGMTLGDLPVIWPYLTLSDLQSAMTGIRLGDIHFREFSEAQVADAIANSDLTLADLTGWDNVTLGEVSVVLDYLTLGDLTPALKGIRLGDFAGRIAKPSGGTYSAEDLKQALRAAMPNATLNDITDWDNVTLGELGTYGDTTLGQLFGALSDEEAGKITLGDVLLALIAPKQYPWDSLDLSKISAQALDQHPSSTQVTVTFSAGNSGDTPHPVEVVVAAPDGATIDPDDLGVLNDVLLDETVDGNVARLTFAGVPAGSPWSFTLHMQAPMTIGPAQVRATASLLDDDAVATDVASTNVTEAFEPNDTVATATPLKTDTITMSHISHAGDIDVYSFDVANPGTRVSLSLSNLNADLDATLYAPPVTLAPTSNRSIVPHDDTTNGLPAAEQSGTDTPPTGAGDDVTAPVDLGSLAVVQGSYHRGTSDERIDTGVLSRTGTYYLAVTGYNGASSRQPYALRLKRTSVPTQPACPARQLTGMAGLTAAPPATLPAGTNTVLLVNKSRMSLLYGNAAANTVMAKVDAFTTWVNAHPEVGAKAVTIQVDGDAGVRSAYAAWDASPCLPSGANGVVSEITRLLNGYRQAGSTITNVVMVGGDDAIPFARVPDRGKVANETEYASTFADAGNALYATFATSSLQSDNPYVDSSPYAFGDRALYVPKASIGRLVESPAEIGDQLTDFQNADGKLAINTGLVTGYDFLTDGSHAVADNLESTYGTVNSQLISDTWTRQDVEDAIHSIKPDVLSINAHFDHYRSLPAEGNATHNESDLLTAAAVRGSLNGDLAGSIVFSMGCHSGLSASDTLLTGDRALDFAQAISSQGGVFVGNTGYGYGDTDIVALSETLMSEFARRLDGSMTVGQALMFAKNDYVASLAEFTPYDEKVVHEATMYGLPFYRLDVATPPVPPILTPTTVTTDPTTGLDSANLTITPTHHTRSASDDTTYVAAEDPVTGEDSVTAVQGQPVEPKVVTELAMPAGSTSHDALVTGLTSVDKANVDPFIFKPVVDDSGERVKRGVDTAFPTSPVRVNPAFTPSGSAYDVAATTGYFRTTDPDGTGLQRTYKSMSVQTFFTGAGSDDFVAPTFSSVAASTADGFLTISAHVADDRGSADRVKRVALLLLDDPAKGVANEWRFADLEKSPDSDEWHVTIDVTGRHLEYILQAVDAAGNVGVTNDKADNFSDPVVPIDPPQIDPPAVHLDGPQGGAGWFTGPVTVSITGGTERAYSIDGGDLVGYQHPFTISSDGVHSVHVSSGDGQTTTPDPVLVPIDTVGPVATIVAPVDGALIAAGTTLTWDFDCPDVGSGAASCDAKVNGSPVQKGGTSVAAPGTYRLTVNAGSDLAGNGPSRRTVRHDFHVVAAPTMTPITVDKFADGTPTTLTANFTGDAAVTYTAQIVWGDGATTACTEAAGACQIVRTDGNGSLSVARTYATSTLPIVATITVVDSLGQSVTRSVTVNQQTTLTATKALLQLTSGGQIKLKSGAISATLVGPTGQPLAGQFLRFTTGNNQGLCSGTTNASGTVTCSGLTLTLQMLLAGSYKVEFAGSGVYRGSTATASLIG